MIKLNCINTGTGIWKKFCQTMSKANEAEYEIISYV